VPVLGAVTLAMGLLRRASSQELLRILRGGALALTLAAALVAPDFARRKAATGSVLGRVNVIFESTAPVRERLVNVVASHCQSAISAVVVQPILKAITQKLTRSPVTFYCANVYRAQEDLAGNPFQATTTLLLLPGLLLLLGGRGVRRLLTLTPLLGWLAMHWQVRNQLWLSRLQLPIFMLTPLLWAAWTSPMAGPLERARRWLARGLYPMLTVVSLVCLAYGYVVVISNSERPLTIPQLEVALRTRDQQYYNVRQNVASGHNAALGALAANACRRLGLVIGDDDYDYPLTWRARRAGIEVRHHTPSADPSWPCAIFSEAGRPAGNWVPATPLLWVRGALP
jgi:hypothetical protein